MTRKKMAVDAAEETVPSVQRETPHEGRVVPPPARVLLAEGTLELVPGSLLVTCARPGFRRAGIEHPRLKVYGTDELTADQLEQMRREPLLTLVEVG